MKKVIIYPGRFQPMLPHHAEVFRKLQAEHTDAEVFIATANKVEPGKSPFDAQEKLSIMTQQHDIPQDRIIIAAGNNLYNKDSYIDAFSPAEEHSLFFAVGEKDMQSGDARFQFKPLKDGSKSYLQNGEDVINTNNAQPMVRHGYVIQAPNVPGISGDVASASAFRSALLSAPDLDSAKETYTRYMGEFNQEIFDLVYDKITGKIMKENLDIIKKLAGLLDEAPVNFKPGKGGMDYEPGISKKDQKAAAERPEKAAASNPASVEFTKIAPEDMISVDTGKPINSRQRARSMANQFPDGADVNDPAVKKEMFLKLLAQSPGYVLGEINARLANDEEGFAVSDRLSAIVDNLPEGGIMALGDEDRKWTIELVNNAINNMELHRKDSELDKFDDLEAEPEPEVDMDGPEMVSLDDPEFDAPEDELEMEEMKKLAGLETKEMKNCGCGLRVCKTTGYVDKSIEEDEDGVYANHVTYVGPNGDKLGTEDCDGELDPDMMAQMVSDEECKMLCDKHNMDYNDTVGCLKFNDGEATMQDGEELPDGTIAFYGGKDGSIEEAEVDEGRMSDIHQDANEMDKEEFAKAHPMFADDWEGMQHQDDPDEPSQDEIDENYTIVKKYIGKKKDESVEESSEDSGEGPISSMSDEELMDYVGQREEDIVDDIQQHIAPDFLHKENYEEMFEKYREEVLEPAAEEISQDKAMDQMPDEMEMDAEESIEDTSGKALEAAMSELKKLAGLNEEDKKEFDKSGCMAEMKKLYANHCTKESMYSKLNAEYNCNRKQFEELYASHCG